MVRLSPCHLTVAVDLRGHGATPGTAAECSIERYGPDVAEVMQALAAPPAGSVGQSMRCRVVIEAALQAPSHTAGVVPIDGSRPRPWKACSKETFSTADGYATLIRRGLEAMFTAKSNAPVVASALERAERLPPPIGEKLLTDMLRYNAGRLTTSLADLCVPVMGVQATLLRQRRRDLVDDIGGDVRTHRGIADDDRHTASENSELVGQVEVADRGEHFGGPGRKRGSCWVSPGEE